MRSLLLAVALAAPLAAQLQVSWVDGATERPLTAVNNLGTTTMGDIADFLFYLHNDTVSGIALQVLTVTGQAYSLTDRPPINYILAPRTAATFHILFAPSSTGTYGATLNVNGVSYLLSAVATGAPTLSLTTAPASVLAAGSTIDFGKLQRNHFTSIALQLANSTNSPLTVQSIAVRGDAFQGPSGITLPATLPAGVAVTFQVTFNPHSAGPQTGVLQVDNRAFNLRGTGFDAPLPQPTIVVSANATSAQQPTLSLTFASVPESSGAGTLTLDFQPSTAIAGDDPTVLFPATGTRQLSFQVNEGDGTALFDKQKAVAFQTGTTAGIITFTATVGAYTVRSSVTIAPAAIVVTAASVNRRVSDILVAVTGYDNSRTGGKMNFVFYDRAGAQIQPGVIRVDDTADFRSYFAISRVGGAFQVRATFPVTGDATQVGAVDVELVNSAGATQTARLNLQ